MHVSHLQTGAVNTWNPEFPNSLEVSAFSDGKPKKTLWYEAVYSLQFRSLHSGGVHNKPDLRAVLQLLGLSDPNNSNRGLMSQVHLINLTSSAKKITQDSTGAHGRGVRAVHVCPHSSVSTYWALSASCNAPQCLQMLWINSAGVWHPSLSISYQGSKEVSHYFLGVHMEKPHSGQRGNSTSGYTALCSWVWASVHWGLTKL